MMTLRDRMKAILERGICVLWLLALLSWSGPFAQGQNRVNVPWWNSPVRADLGLSPAQDQKIRQIVRSYRSRLLDARNNVQKAEGDLEDVMNDPDVSLQSAQPVIDKVAAARGQSSKVFLEMSVELRGVLTLDQWRTLVKRWEEVQRKKVPDTQTPP